MVVIRGYVSKDIPEILDELDEVLHGLDDLRDGQVVQHLLAVPAQLPETKQVPESHLVLFCQRYILQRPFRKWGLLILTFVTFPRKETNSCFMLCDIFQCISTIQYTRS
jgi:hypothetical protein